MTKLGEMFNDRNGKTSGKRVIGTIGALASLGMGYVQILSDCDKDYTVMIVGLFTASVGLVASSIMEKKNANTQGSQGTNA